MKIRGGVSLGALVLAMAAAAGPALAQDAGPARKWPTQKSAGQVTLEATPAWSGEALVITLAANTHSVDLGSVDLREAVRLYVGDAAYTPIDAGSLGGHHGQAEVVFSLPEAPAAFRLEIRGVPDVTLRVLRWPPAEGGRQ